MYPNINLMRLCRESNNNNNEKFKDVLSELEKLQNSHPKDGFAREKTVNDKTNKFIDDISNYFISFQAA